MSQSHKAVLAGLITMVLISGTSIRGDEAGFSFSLDRVERKTVWLTCEKGCTWETVSYGGGEFFVSMDGVQTAGGEKDRAETPGLRLELNRQDKTLKVTCRAEMCGVSGPPHSRMMSQDLTPGKSAVVPVASGMRFTISK